MKTELTVPDIINDPMIRILNKADRISERAFAQLMESAARVAQRSAQALPKKHPRNAQDRPTAG